MRITKVALENVRRFTSPIELGLSGGVNLIYGPNEAGKSTVAAAIQAVFLERATSVPVRDNLAPYQNSSLVPKVEVHFEHVGQEYRLAKIFGAARGRTELEVGGTLTYGEEAEARIADLFRFKLPKKGASRDNTRGITALTWINQGADTNLSQQLESSHHDLLTIVDATGASNRRSAASALVDRIEDRIKQLGGGRSKGDLNAVKEEAESCRHEIEEIQKKLERLSRQAAELDQLREGGEEEKARRRAAGFAEQLERARQEFQELQVHKERLSSLKNQEKTAVETERMRKQHLDTLQRQQREFEEGSGELRKKRQRQGELREQVATAKTVRDRWHLRVVELGEKVAARQALQKRFEDRKTLDDVEERLRELETKLDRGREQLEVIAQVKDRMPGFSKKEFDEVERRWRELEERKLRLGAVSGSLRVTGLGGAEILLDGQPVTQAQVASLAHPHQIVVPGVIEVTTDPGSGLDDWERLEDRQRELATEIGRLGAVDFADLSSKNRERERNEVDIEIAKARVSESAPNGIDELQLRVEQLREQAASLSESAAGSGELLTVEDHPEEELAEARNFERNAGEDLRKLENDLIAIDAAAVQLEAQLSGSAWSLDSAQAGAELEDATLRCEEASRGVEGVRRQVSEMEQAFDPEQEERIRTEIRRLSAAQKNAGEEAQRVREQTIALKTALDEAGNQEYYKNLELLRARLDLAERRSEQLHTTIDGLKMLKQAAESQVEALREQLASPIRDRLNFYFGILDTGRKLDIADNFMPERGGPGGPESFEKLSYGTQEQLAALTRLALLDLVAEKGVPAFLILDDALVNSDDIRLTGMARVVREAGTKHQILVFTCHIDRWEQIGASTSINLRSLYGS